MPDGTDLGAGTGFGVQDGVVEVSLAEPPVVVSAGVGRHGTTRSVDRFHLHELWSLHLYSYQATLTVDGIDHLVRPGSVSLVPPNTQIQYRYRGPSEHLYAHVRATSVGSRRRIDLVQDAGPDLPVLTDLMTSAVAHAAGAPDRTRADVWTVLLVLAERHATASGDDVRYRYVAAATRYIESNLAEPLTVPAVAAAVGISHNHLTRLFRAELGRTVVGHLRSRRMARARHLLQESTMPIGAVASSVGVPDLQAFNKACRAEYGASPRQLRSQA